MIEGRALLLNGLGPGEPPLRAPWRSSTAMKTVQFNVEAQAEAPDQRCPGRLQQSSRPSSTSMTSPTGTSTWARTSLPSAASGANVLTLFKADAYLMMDMLNASTLAPRMGLTASSNQIWIGCDQLKIDFDATLEGNGLVTVRPEQFRGMPRWKPTSA